MTVASIILRMDEAHQIDRALRTLEAQYGIGFPDPGDDGGDDGSGWDAGDGGGSGGPLITYPPGSLWLALAMTNDPTYGNMAAHHRQRNHQRYLV